MSDLHARVVAGDVSAREEIATEALTSVRRALNGAFRGVDPVSIIDAAEDAAIAYLLNPGRYDPSRGIPLRRFLYVIARRRLLNRLRDNTARCAHEVVGLMQVDPAYVPALAGVAGEHSRRSRYRVLMSITTNGERAALRQWLAGGSRDDIALALGYGTRSARERHLEVKRFKDRVRRRVQRLMSKYRLEDCRDGYKSKEKPN